MMAATSCAARWARSLGVGGTSWAGSTPREATPWRAVTRSSTARRSSISHVDSRHAAAPRSRAVATDSRSAKPSRATTSSSERSAATPTIGAIDDQTPVLGGIANGGATNDTTPLLSGTAEAGATVTIREGATVLGTATANVDGDWTFATSALSVGIHTLTATATDLAGNVSAPADFTVTIVTQAPVITSGDLVVFAKGDADQPISRFNGDDEYYLR